MTAEARRKYRVRRGLLCLAAAGTIAGCGRGQMRASTATGGAGAPTTAPAAKPTIGSLTGSASVSPAATDVPSADGQLSSVDAQLKSLDTELSTSDSDLSTSEGDPTE